MLAAGEKDLVCVCVDMTCLATLINCNILSRYFTASWCGPCKKMAPIVDAMSVKHKNVKFVKVCTAVDGSRKRTPFLFVLIALQVDVDALREIAEDSSVDSVPTFALYRQDNHLASVVGADVVGLEAALIKHQHCS